MRAYGVLIVGNRVALVRSSNPRHVPPLWWLPGGGVDFGESPEDTVLREFTEETGYEVTAPRLLGVSSDLRRRTNGDQVHTVRVIYTVELVGGDLTHEANGTTDHAAWFDLPDLSGMNVADYARVAIEAAQAK